MLVTTFHCWPDLWLRDPHSEPNTHRALPLKSRHTIQNRQRLPEDLNCGDRLRFFNSISFKRVAILHNLRQFFEVIQPHHVDCRKRNETWHPALPLCANCGWQTPIQFPVGRWFLLPPSFSQSHVQPLVALLSAYFRMQLLFRPVTREDRSCCQVPPG